MTDLSTAYHEAAHAVAALELGLPVMYLSIRPAEGEAGRTRFDTKSEGFQKLDAFTCAIIKVAGEVGERMAAGATSAQFNWFAEGGDAEDARHFIASLDGDELDARHWATFRAYALLRTRWEPSRRSPACSSETRRSWARRSPGSAWPKLHDVAHVR